MCAFRKGALITPHPDSTGPIKKNLLKPQRSVKGTSLIDTLTCALPAARVGQVGRSLVPILPPAVCSAVCRAGSDHVLATLVVWSPRIAAGFPFCGLSRLAWACIVAGSATQEETHCKDNKHTQVAVCSMYPILSVQSTFCLSHNADTCKSLRYIMVLNAPQVYPLSYTTGEV